MATLSPITQANNCGTSDGGIIQSYYTDFSNITAATFTATGQISAFTMTGTSQWIKFVYDDDDSAFYNQTGTRTGKKHTYAQQAFMKFEAISQANVQAAENFKECCELVGIHVFNSGVIMVQGLEDDGTGTMKRTKISAKGTINVLSDTGDNTDRIEITVDSESKRVHTVGLTTAQIEAL